MPGFLVSCLSDWNEIYFKNGINEIVKGARTHSQIRGNLMPHEILGRDYYRERDPDFNSFTYAVSNRRMRRQIQPGDLIFFRTLWRGRHFIFAYFTIGTKTGPADNPICVGDPISCSQRIPFANCLVLNKTIARILNPRATFNGYQKLDKQLNHWLGTAFPLSDHGVDFLKEQVRSRVASFKDR